MDNNDFSKIQGFLLISVKRLSLNFTSKFQLLSEFKIITGYLHYKTITSQDVPSEAQVKNFLIRRKVVFRSQDIQIKSLYF